MRKNLKKGTISLLVMASLTIAPFNCTNHTPKIFAEEPVATTPTNAWSEVLSGDFTLKQPETITGSAVRIDSKNMRFTYGNIANTDWNYTLTNDTILKVDAKKADTSSFDVQGIKQGNTEITFFRSKTDGNNTQRDAFQTYLAEVSKDGTLTMQLLVSYDQGEFSFLGKTTSDGIDHCTIEHSDILKCIKKEEDAATLDDKGNVYYQTMDGQQYTFVGQKAGTTTLTFYYTDCTSLGYTNKLLSKTYEITVLEDKTLSVKEVYGTYDHLADLPIHSSGLTMIQRGTIQHHDIKNEKIAQLEKTISVRDSLKDIEDGYNVTHYLFRGKKEGTTTFTTHECQSNKTNGIDTVTQYEIKVDKNLNATIKKVSTGRVGYVYKVHTTRKTANTATVEMPTMQSVNGYQIICATNKKFTQNKRVITTKKQKTTMKKLKKRKTYYVKVRGYKTVKGKKIYSMYSNVSKIKG